MLIFESMLGMVLCEERKHRQLGSKTKVIESETFQRKGNIVMTQASI
jgi:hypothetical protein